ncbi:MAG: hypothetical protein U0003_04990 [Vampirovibrionales bacterium]
MFSPRPKPTGFLPPPLGLWGGICLFIIGLGATVYTAQAQTNAVPGLLNENRPTDMGQSPSPLHKQVRWGAIKTFLQTPVEETDNPETTQSSTVRVSTPQAPAPLGWTADLLTQLSRLETTVYGTSVEPVQLTTREKWPANKRLARLEATLHLHRTPWNPPTTPTLTQQRLSAIQHQLQALNIPTAQRRDDSVNPWALALMEARVFQGAVSNQSDEERVRALEIAVFGSEKSATQNPQHPPTPALSLAQRVNLLGEHFPLRRTSRTTHHSSAASSARLAPSTETDWLADEHPATKPAPAPVAILPSLHSPTKAPSSPTPRQPLSSTNATPSLEPVSLPALSTAAQFESSLLLQPLGVHVYVWASNPNELNQLLETLDNVQQTAYQLVRYPQLADVWLAVQASAYTQAPHTSGIRLLTLNSQCTAYPSWSACLEAELNPTPNTPQRLPRTHQRLF